MDHRSVGIPESLRYRDGQYAFERFPSTSLNSVSLRGRRMFTRTLRGIHRPWFALRMPDGVAEITTTGRKSGQPRSTFVRAYHAGDKAYLVAIGGEYTLWLKNIRANPRITLRFREGTFGGVARDPNDAERPAVEAAFCTVHPFDYAENMLHRKGLPNKEKIVELHRAWLEGGTTLVVDLD